MSFKNRIASLFGVERRSDGDPYWNTFQALQTTPVNSHTAQGVSAVYACVSAVAETIASLPLILFKREGDDRTRATEHPLYSVLHD